MKVHAGGSRGGHHDAERLVARRDFHMAKAQSPARQCPAQLNVSENIDTPPHS